jgi:hypothetical protein
MKKVAIVRDAVFVKMDVNGEEQVKSDERALDRHQYPGQFLLINYWTLTW